MFCHPPANRPSPSAGVTPRAASWILILAALLGGCGDDNGAVPEESPAATPAPAAGLYEGTFPCADCPGIDITLWLRPDGRYFLRQHYRTSAEAGGEHYYGLGRWQWDAAAVTLTLRGGGPERIFELREGGLLALRVPSDLSHHVSRSGGLVPFTDTLALQGEYRTTDGKPVFRECRTGLEWPVAAREDYRSLRHQYGRVPRGETALVQIRGRLEGNGDPVLTVSELIRLEPGGRCP